MLSVNVATLVQVTGGELLAGDLDKVANSLCIDSRCVRSGCAFVALPGENVDGHEFALSAIDGGARVTVVTDPPMSSRSCLRSRRCAVWPSCECLTRSPLSRCIGPGSNQ